MVSDHKAATACRSASHTGVAGSADGAGDADRACDTGYTGSTGNADVVGDADKHWRF